MCFKINPWRFSSRMGAGGGGPKRELLDKVHLKNRQLNESSTGSGGGGHSSSSSSSSQNDIQHLHHL